eukprot:NODE_14_length_42432_cov_0.433799.p25 type:complete len:112 gc:universal NODE_14_length_42432_cov_0.433799:11422-11087(-)
MFGPVPQRLCMYTTAISCFFRFDMFRTAPIDCMYLESEWRISSIRYLKNLEKSCDCIEIHTDSRLMIYFAKFNACLVCRITALGFATNKPLVCITKIISYADFLQRFQYMV